MSLLELQDVSVFYGDFQALFSISLTVEEGQTFAVIGANGAGKSTMLKTVAGVLRPRSGRVLFEGEPVDQVSAHKRVSMGICLLYTSDAADDLTRVDLGGRRIIKKKKKK